MPPFHRGPRRRPSIVGTVRGGTPLALPQATTLPASSVGPSGAFLNGSINPQGSATNWWFVWGSTPQYGSQSSSSSGGAGSTPEAVGFQLTGLTAGASYHFAVVAQSTAGTVFGVDMSFVAQAPSPVTNASTPLVPFGSGLDTPHLKYPMMIRSTGADVVEQDTLDEVFACVRAVMDCPVGACPELPGFGVPDPTFGNAPVDPVPLVAAVQRWEPRATQDAAVSAIGDANAGSWQVRLTTEYAGENGQIGS